MTQEDILAATKTIIAKQLERIEEDKRIEWLTHSLAIARARLDDGLVKAESQKYGRDDAKRSASYRAEIVFLRGLLLANGIKTDIDAE